MTSIFEPCASFQVRGSHAFSSVMFASVRGPSWMLKVTNAKERTEARKNRLISLNRDYDRSLGHPRHAVIITDAAVPLLSTGHQAVAAWNVWHRGSCISEDWQAGGLAISDDTETFAIAGAFSALASEMDINDVDEIHVFMDSTTAIRQSLDPSIHSAQEYALEILFLITPWVEQGNKRIHFHHVPDSEDYMFKIGRASCRERVCLAV